MTITHASLTESGSITAGPIEGQTWYGLTTASRFWPEVQAWLDAGNTLLPAPTTVTALGPLTPRQLRLTLLHIGITEASVDELFDAIPDPDDRAWARIEWKYATAFTRDHPLVQRIGEALKFTPSAIDTLWEWAGDL